MAVDERSRLLDGREHNGSVAHNHFHTDTTNPKNWPTHRKWLTAILVSFYSLASAISPALIVPAIPQIAHDLNLVSENAKQALVSTYVLTWSFGPVFWAPLSEAYGRATLLNLGHTMYLIASLLCAMEWNGTRFLVWRFVAGFFGSAANAIGGGLMSDLWIPEERGKSLAVYALVPLLGSAVGAIAGGLVVQNTSWRNLFWGTSAFVACCLVCGFLFVHETFAPVIVRRKRAKYLTEVDAVTMPTTKTSKTLQSVFKDDLPRPFVLLATQPIIWALGLFMGYLWGLNFLMISTYQALWQDKYHQTSSNASLNYISISLGFIIGCEIVGPINDRIYAFYKIRNNNVGTLEFRTIIMIPASLLVPFGLLWYGWSAESHLHWIMPNVGMTIYSCGVIIIYQGIQAYAIDTYPTYAASAMGSLSIMRAVTGFIFPLLGPMMFGHLGYGWAGTLMAGLAAVIGLLAALGLKTMGAKLRARSTYALGDADISFE